jgi:ABC-type polysaccharide/polyol phosphate export permease
MKNRKNSRYAVAFINMCMWVVVACISINFLSTAYISPASQNLVDPSTLLKKAMVLIKYNHVVLILICLVSVVFNFGSIVMTFISNRSTTSDSEHSRQ